MPATNSSEEGQRPPAEPPSPSKHDVRLASVRLRHLSFDRQVELGEAYSKEYEVNHQTRLREHDEHSFTIGFEASLHFGGSDLPPFSLAVHLDGVFEHGLGLPPELRQYYVDINATILLWPYLREIVDSIVARAGYPRLMVPTLDVRSFVERRTREIREVETEEPAE